MQETLDMTGCARGFSIETYSGRFVDITNIYPSEICLMDIAHSLSLQCRFNGHVERFFSVAEHSVAVSRLLPPEMQLIGLLHDASESYLCDIPRPLKPLVSNYYDLEKKVQDAIYAKFGIYEFDHAALKDADNAALKAEAKELVWSGGKDWDMTGVPDYNFPVRCLSPKKAKREFLERFAELY